MSDESPRLGCKGDHTSLDSLINCERCSNIILDIRGQAVHAYLDKIVMLKREIKFLESALEQSNCDSSVFEELKKMRGIT
jgi:hypothetical protein